MSTLKKVPHLLNTEELLNVIESSKEFEKNDEDFIALEPVNNNDVLTFISTFKIAEGDHGIKKSLLYSIYKAWSKSPVNRITFSTELANFIQVKHEKYYHININAVKLTHEVYTHYKNNYKTIKSKHYARHYQNFLNYHAIESKDFWIELDILYFLYDKYTHEMGFNTKSTQVLSKKKFELFSNLFLRNKITQSGKVYAVSSNINNFFQPGQIERMKKEYAKEKKETSKNKAKQKRKARVPRTRSKI